MKLFYLLLDHAVEYGLLWLPMLAIAYCTARYMRWWCIPIGQTAIGVLVLLWAANMANNGAAIMGSNGSNELGVVFLFGVAVRTILINSFLVPVTALGLWQRRIQNESEPRARAIREIYEPVIMPRAPTATKEESPTTLDFIPGMAGFATNVPAEQSTPSDLYSDTLRGMQILLTTAGEDDWRWWIEQDILAWGTRKSVAHHLDAFGGSGSIEALEFVDVWINTSFDQLRTLSSYLARCLKAGASADHVGDLFLVEAELLGWRCSTCQFASASQREVEAYRAEWIVLEGLSHAVQKGTVQAFIERIINEHPDDLAPTEATILGWMEAGGVQLRSGEGLMRPCPNCKSFQTVNYGWILERTMPMRLVPSKGNVKPRLSLSLGDR